MDKKVLLALTKETDALVEKINKDTLVANREKDANKEKVVSLIEKDFLDMVEFVKEIGLPEFNFYIKGEEFIDKIQGDSFVPKGTGYPFVVHIKPSDMAYNKVYAYVGIVTGIARSHGIGYFIEGGSEKGKWHKNYLAFTNSSKVEAYILSNWTDLKEKIEAALDSSIREYNTLRIQNGMASLNEAITITEKTNAVLEVSA